MRYLFLIWIIGTGISAVAQEGGLPTNRRKVIQSTKNDFEKGVTKRTRSKIVNDSVKTVYGPKTTLSSTEKDIFENKKNYVPLDTSIFNRHRWDFVQKNENKYQDLGNLGTALNPVFPLLSGMIGATPGFKVYDLYYESAAPRFYNTKSPFSRINIMWGGRGRSITHIEFTRNINPRWNLGMNYRPVLSAAQIGYSGNKNYQVTSHYYDFYTSYESKNSKYKLLLSYRRIRHHVKENGGVFLPNDSTSTYKDYFDPNVGSNFAISTTTPRIAITDELRNNVHMFHQFQLAKPAQLYHVLDVNKQVNTFHFNKSATTSNYFATSFIDTTVINDINTFQSVQNEVGLKGNAAFLFYDFYYKLRTYGNNMANLQGQAPHAIGTENYIGSRITLKYDSLSYLSGQAEYLLDGHYKIEGALRTPWLDADLRSSLSKAGLMQQAYRGGFNIWTNNFTDVFSNQLSGHIKAKFGPLFFSPGLTYTALHNYIYFVQRSDIPQQATPQQSGSNQQIVSPELKMEIRLLKRFHLRPQVIYTTLFNNEDHAVSIPTWFTNIQLSYENVIFNGALQLQVGLDTHYKSAYKAMGYAPAIQQYYIQDTFTNTPFWSTDVFLNGRIKRGRFFVKYVNLVQQFTKQGYLPTPYYPNVRSTIDFGFELILFD